MVRFLPFVLVFFPALELWVMIRVGARTGALAVVVLVLFSIVAGLALLRLRGARAARSMAAEFAEGRIPSDSLVDALSVMVAGCLFLLPGFLSDAMALLLLVPFVRRPLLALFARMVKSRVFRSRAVYFHASREGGGQAAWTVTGHRGGRSVPDHEGRGGEVVIDCEPEAAGTGTIARDGAAHSGKPEKRG